MRPIVAYLLLTHEDRPQLGRLIRVLRAGSPAAPIVVHHDVSRSPPPRTTLEAADAQLLSLVRDIEWGDFSIVDAVLRSLAWMREHVRFDWVVLLSGADYPVRPLPDIEEDLARLGADALLEVKQRVDPAHRPDVYDKHEALVRRYYFRYHRLPRWVPAESSLTAKALDRAALPLSQSQRIVHIRPLAGRWRAGYRAPRPPFSEERPCLYGSQWFTLSHRAVDLLLEQLRADPRWLRHYRRTIIPDESIVQSLLVGHPRLRVVCDNKRFMRWPDGRSDHPYTLTMRDLDSMLSSGDHFARKVDDRVDAQLIDELDAVVLSQ